MKRVVLLCLMVLLFGFAAPVSAQEMSLGSGTSIVVNDKNVVDGDIIIASNHGYKLATQAYDSLVFGVVNIKPAIYLEDRSLKNAVPAVTVGKAFVRVSTINGAIHRGMQVTSSTMPGVGQLATSNGYVLGTAEEEYTEKDPKKIGKILVVLDPHYNQTNNNITANLLEAFQLGFVAAAQSPVGALRYIASAFIAIVAFYLGFRFFGNASRNGVEAIGRNPLASRTILLSVAFNVIVTVTFMFLGVALAYAILVI